MREIVSIHIGQCGNQIGYSFWKAVLEECRKLNLDSFDTSLQSLFNNFDEYHSALPMGSRLDQLKARSILIDMEPNVIEQTLTSEIGDLFDMKLIDSSGSGNNWGRGYWLYGSKHNEEIDDLIRRQLEFCDSCDSLLFTCSAMGGTGSGLGSFVLEQVADNHAKKISKVVATVFPSGVDDDVVTGAYNAGLCMEKLREYADIIVPFDNLALGRMNSPGQEKSFDGRNSLIARLLIDLTSPHRFRDHSEMEYRMSQLPQCLKPSQYCNYLIPSIAPLGFCASLSNSGRGFDQMFSDVARMSSNGLISLSSKLKNPISLGSGFSVRTTPQCVGGISDIYNNIEKTMKSSIFLKSRPSKYTNHNILGISIGPETSLTMLNNSTAIRDVFKRVLNRAQQMYSRRAYVHHYDEFICEDLGLRIRDTIFQCLSDYKFTL
jgi:tubulin epsilon